MSMRASAGNTRAVVMLAAGLASFVWQPVAFAGDPPVHNITQDTNYFTIQDAINAANNDDLIRMDPGFYFEHIDFLGKWIVVENPTHDFNDVTIGFPAAAGSLPIVSFVNGEGPGAQLQYVTVAGGNVPGSGGGIQVHASNPVILNCFLLGNSAGGTGGGIAVTGGGNPLIDGCAFLANNTPGEGGALSVDGASAAQVQGCSFDINSSNGGGAIHSSGTLTVTRCAFTGNIANFDGSAILSDGGNLSLVDCWFYDNHGNGSQGSAVSNIFGSVATVTNCTFASNVGNANGGFDSFASDATITNCIFWNNAPGEITNVAGGTTTVNFSDVAGGWVGPGTGNIDADPLFVAPNGSDAHLTSASTCANAGDDNAPLLPALDLDGLPRIQQCRTDMGAYESSSIGVDCNGNEVSDACDIEQDTYSIDDGFMENFYSLDSQNHTFANQYNAGGGRIIGAVAVAFNGTMQPGDPVTVYIWDDPNSDGLPDDAVLVASAGGVIGASSSNSPKSNPAIFDVFPITPTSVTGSFFVGVSTSTSGLPMSVDENTPLPNRSWATSDLGSINTATQLPDGLLLMVRARLSADANANSIPDSCETPNDFGAPQEFVAFGEPGVQTVGDLDGDGDVDVVAVIPDTSPLVNGAIQVLLNNGVSELGKWQGLSPQPEITVGRAPSSAAVGLFNDDLHLDLAVTNAGDDNVTILINNGNGTFSSAGTVAVGDAPSSIVTAQLNKGCDAFVDLAVSNEASDDVYLLFGDGAGGFSQTDPCLGRAVGPIHVSQTPVAMGAGDFDGNKDPDLSGGSSGSAGAAGVQPGTVFVLLSNGDGTFQGPFYYPVGVDPRDIAIGDLNFDGFQDIATSDAGGTGTVTLLLNDGTGYFNITQTLNVAPGARSVDAADLDGDGDNDLAVVALDPVIGAAVIVLQNIADIPGQVAFAAPLALSVDADPNFVVAADMNGDPALDLVTVNADTGASGGSVTVLLNTTLVAACPWDMGGDGSVDVTDLLSLLSLWGTDPGGPPDFDVDGIVDTRDFMLLLNAWGPCP